MILAHKVSKTFDSSAEKYVSWRMGRVPPALADLTLLRLLFSGASRRARVSKGSEKLEEWNAMMMEQTSRRITLRAAASRQGGSCLRYATTASQGVATLVDAPCLKASLPLLSSCLTYAREERSE